MIATRRRQVAPLPVERLEQLEGWAMVRRAAGYVWRPETEAEIRAVFDVARQTGRTVALRGTGNSYNDAALNAEDIILDLSQMRRVVDWDSHNGFATLQAGATIRDLWRLGIQDGWWPWVVPGTMNPTLGGSAAMNVHGKNAWRHGSIGEYILSFDLLLPSGATLTLTPQDDRFFWVIGGFGMLGVITSVTLKLRQVPTPTLDVCQFAAGSLAEMFALFAEHHTTAEYLVGWLDGFASGAHLGRGLVERADFSVGGDPTHFAPERQDLSPRIAGVVPRSQLWRVMKPIFTDPMMRLANLAQYRRGALSSKPHRVPHAQFHFFHDYVPNWKRSWLPGGLRQFQAFVPAEQAQAVFKELLERSQRAGIPPYLCVLKQHRADPFALSYQMEGCSLSLDYHVTAANSDRISGLITEMREPVIAAGGKFYLAKDDSLDAATYARTNGAERVAKFLALKRQMDPEGLLQSDMARRVLGED